MCCAPFQAVGAILLNFSAKRAGSDVAKVRVAVGAD